VLALMRDFGFHPSTLEDSFSRPVTGEIQSIDAIFARAGIYRVADATPVTGLAGSSPWSAKYHGRVALTIGIDARAAAEVPAGRGRFVRELLSALARRDDPDTRYVLYARERWDGLDASRFGWRLSPLCDSLWHAAVAGYAARETDVFLSTNSYLTPMLSHARVATMVHDLVPFVVGDVARTQSMWIEKATIRPAIRRSRALICNSEATRVDLVRCFPQAAPKASVALLAADASFEPSAAPADAAARPFVLAVGTFEPRKNLRRLVAAWQALPARIHETHDLVLVGPKGWGDAGVESAGTGGSVRIAGRVDDDELRRLYAACACFVYPSLYEGFGLPILEAMASRAPVITSDVSSMPEIAGDAALLVDPLDEAAIGQAILAVLDDPALAASLRERGAIRAATFSWDRTAQTILDVLRTIAAP
jgi:glycosyltransferase involved in cell wall biosynthesis